MQEWNDVISGLTVNARACLETGVTILIRSVLPLAAALTAGWLLRNRDARGRARIYAMGLAATMLLCPLSLMVKGSAMWSVALPTARQVTNSVSELPPFKDTVSTGRGRSIESRESTPSTVTSDARPITPTAPSDPLPSRPGALPTDFFYAAVLLVWLGGAGASLAWLCLCQYQIARVRGRAVPASDRQLVALMDELCGTLRVKRPELLVSADTTSPFVSGLLRPCVIVPATLLSRTDSSTLRAILAHEMHHIVSGDIAWALAARLSCIVLWPQPLLRLLVNRWREAMEEACDSAALKHDCSPQSYARCLVRIAEAFTSLPTKHAAALGIANSRYMLGRRVERILNSRARTASRLPPVVFGSAIMLFGFVLALSCRLVAAQPPQPAKPETPSTASPVKPAQEPPAATEDERRRDREQELYRKGMEAARIEWERGRAKRNRARDSRRRAEQAAKELRDRAAALERQTGRGAQGDKLRAERAAEKRAAELLAEQRDLERQAERRAAEHVAARKTAEMEARRAADQMADSSRELEFLQKALMDREATLSALNLKYSAAHPKIREAQAVIDSLRQRLDELNRSRASIRERAALASAARQSETESLDRAAKLRAELAARDTKRSQDRATLLAEQARLRSEQTRRADETAALKAQVAELKAQLERLQRQQEELRKKGN